MPPWCDGFSSDASSSSAGANWIEDLVLREDVINVWDKWVAHRIPFSDPRTVTAFNDVGEILLNGKWVNSVLGGVTAIDTSTRQDDADALVAGTWAMTHQASAFVDDLTGPGGVSATLALNGDFWAFILPPVTTDTTPITGGGQFVAAFSADSSTRKVQQYLVSDSWARTRVALGGAISPDTGLGQSTENSATTAVRTAAPTAQKPDLG